MRKAGRSILAALLYLSAPPALGQLRPTLPVVHVEFHIEAPEYKLCLKNELSQLESALSGRLAQIATDVNELKFVNWIASKNPAKEPVLSVLLVGRGVGFQREIILRFGFNGTMAPRPSDAVVYPTLRNRRLGDPGPLKARVVKVASDQLYSDGIQQWLLVHLGNLPIAKKVDIPSEDLVVIPQLKRNDLQAGKDSKLRVAWDPARPMPSDRRTQLTLQVTEELNPRWLETVQCNVSPRWSEKILTLFNNRDDSSVRVYMTVYSWQPPEFDGPTQTTSGISK